MNGLARLVAVVAVLALAGLGPGGLVARPAAAQPSIVYTFVPAWGAFDDLLGAVSGVDVAQHRVATVIRVGAGYWTKPTFGQPTVPIASDGQFRVDITTGGVDETADHIVSFLVSASYSPPALAGQPTIPAELFQNALAMVEARRGETRRNISWSGRSFWVKASQSPVGPGPTYFSDSDQNVSVVGDQLVLRLTRRETRWWGAEVVTNDRDFGYGRYVFTLAGDPRLNEHVVLGLFTWNDDPAFSHREIDVEIARWSNPADPTNAQYVVQPYTAPGALRRFLANAVGESIHSFEWYPDRVVFESRDADGTIVSSYEYRGAVPPPSAEVRLNLWLNEGRPPSDGRDVEVVVKRFEYAPLVPEPACASRPPVGVRATPDGPERLRVVVAAQPSATLARNELRSLRFNRTDNALVDIGGRAGRSGTFAVGLPAGTQSTTFYVRRAEPRGAAMAHFEVVDVCTGWGHGWPSFVGAGPGGWSGP